TALTRVEDYLNGISTMMARFTQTSEAGGVAEGDFYLSRPGRMRIEYDDQPYLYIADGTWLTYYDKELGQRSDVLLGSTLADFVTRRNIELSGEVTVTGLRRNEQSIEIDLVQTDDPGQGSLTLVFDRQPLQLRRWVVLDAQGTRTMVALHDIATDVQLSGDLFVTPRRQ
ncbi:MAG TPA: outer membrane lipoprotein carrier protein LolA, partial [Alphaproteobacteria bacterium]|nr:outer membrane lipoprotein carrier protein LolA [Alphaproteobacteria bacterium]